MSEVISQSGAVKPEMSARAIGSTVFELLARPIEATEPAAQNGTWTMKPTIWATGDPGTWNSDRDYDPDND